MAILILPSRLHSGGTPNGDNWVVSVNNRSGQLTIAPEEPITVTTGSQTIYIGVQPDYFVRKIGDTVWGNLLMAPSGEGYGLKLHTRADDPGDNALGATYFKTSDNTLRVFDGTTYRAVGAGLTEDNTDNLYLRLDGTNGPMTGELRLGSQFLRLGVLSSEPTTGINAQVYFNTATNKARVWYSNAWHTLGGGSVEQILGGDGILVNGVASATLTTSGTLSVDEDFNYHWTGDNTFDAPITFSVNQTFDISKLYAAGQTTGDLILLTPSGWVRLPKGTDGQVLQIDATTHLPTWKDTLGGTIGTPTDGTYTDGYFVDWQPNTTVADAVDDISELLALLAPAQSGSLTGQGLTLNTAPTIVATVKLSNMPSTQLDKWRNKKTGAALSPGDTITNGYYRSGSLTASTPSGTFRAGKVNDSSTWGAVSHKIYRWTGAAVVGSLLNTFNMTPGTLGSTGTIQLTSFNTFNSLWKQGSARINSYATTNEGYTASAIYHTGAGESNPLEYWYDTASASTPNPSFSSAPSATEQTLVLKYLSGISYYGLNSTFLVSFGAASGIFDRCYNASQVAQFSGTGIDTTAHKFSPSSPPMYNDAYDCTGGSAKVATLGVANQNSMTKQIAVNIYKADNTTVAANAALAKAVNTWSVGATDVLERFVDESYRLVLGTTAAWTPSAALLDGNAQVRNGTLLHGAAGDYSGHTSVAEYQRFIFINSRSTGTFTFTGFTTSDIAPYGTGSVNVLIELESPNKFFDMGVPVGSGGNGSSRSLASGGRNGLPSGGVVNFSLGTESTQVSGVGNNGRFRLIIIFRDTTKAMTQVTVS